MIINLLHKSDKNTIQKGQILIMGNVQRIALFTVEVEVTNDLLKVCLSSRK